MSQSVIVIHGAGEPRLRHGEIYWKPMLSEGLGAGYDVQASRMPDPEDPHHEPWAARIAELMAAVDRPIMVAHSFGASTLLKMLGSGERVPSFAGLFLLATPFWGAKFPEFALTSEELGRLREVLPMTFYHSRDDEVIEFGHFERYREALPGAGFRAVDGRGHEFDQPEFPELVADIWGLMGR